ncbi:MAG TPA: hypothetical protein VFQ20_14905 [Burkholderiaceae bacterium]|nr:hypothetical protein [Burkholderiaceae bacterium]
MLATAPDSVAPTLPIVVQIGFAGSRFLFAPQRLAPDEERALQAELRDALVGRLAELPGHLGLAPQHVMCGVSQLAIGADAVFTEACGALGLPQRVLLPQPLAAFLAAGDAGDPDFTPAEQDAARALLAGAHIAELRVASDAEDRIAQFEDTNLALLDESDAVVCLLRAGALGRPGGTRDLIERAAQAGKPVLLLEVSMDGGRPRLSPWSMPEAARLRTQFRAPGMPAEVAGLAWPPAAGGALPDAKAYIDAVRRFASARTQRVSGGFRRAAITIIALHVAATLLATLAGKAAAAGWIAALLAIELACLGVGLGIHQRLHRSASVRAWATTRLLAEVLRSMRSVAATAVAIDYPRRLALPAHFAPLLRTADILHGLQARRADPGDWAAQRARYVDERLTGAQGQLGWFERAAAAASQRWVLAQRLFWIFSATAFAATAAKLAAVLGWLPAALQPTVSSWGGLLAIVLPVVAVGCLSWAAAADLEARAKTYADMHAFLGRQVDALRGAASARDFARAVRETELGLLAETLGWFARRMWKGVA